MATLKRENGGIVGVENLPTQNRASGIWGLNEVLEARKESLWPRSVYGYPIEQSLRCDGTSFLSRYPTSLGNRKTWTWSGWVKRGNLGTNQVIFSTEAGSGNTNCFIFDFTSSDQLDAYDYTGGATVYRLVSNSVYRDASAWYHIVLEYDTTQATSSDRVKLYINGQQVTSFSIASYPSQNYDGYVNVINTHYISTQHTTSAINTFGGYLANIQFIDGQALDASSFGELVSGVWIPKAYTGTYGTNGFHLDFTNNDTGLNISTYNTSTHDIFSDSSAIATYSLNGDATDLGGSYDATASNITYGTGKFGQAAVFNGSNSVISRTDQVLPTSGDYSISIWFNPASGFLSTLWGLFSSFQFNTSNGIGIYGDSTNFICNFGNGKAIHTKVPDARWIHCVAVLNGTTGRLYIDAAHLGSVTSASNTINTSCDFKLGLSSRTSNGSYTYSQYFNGSIDEVRVFNKALSISEIETLYATGGDTYFLDKSGSNNHWLGV